MKDLLEAARRAARLLAMHRVECEQRGASIRRPRYWGSSQLADLVNAIEQYADEPQTVADYLESRRELLP